MSHVLNPFTDTVMAVEPADVSSWVAKGYTLLDGEAEHVPEAAPAEEQEQAEPKPTEDNTISEIRAYCKRHGIKMSRGASKADMLRLID